ncbi:hybrid sensor histidine kinase/response regulator [Spirulina subsalsa FACHB-351]|uniref:histidine kinase n=1 Tax=Spirulina subsalsa FACHB-351 TaxID=234711 RepID=A0ABT3L7K6_9CYAN|nr:hybrid sensor histidine kinase/response regulator [Spirulina subsalsa]MCW6037475.1 hybrid sensor histidine kinase/response regulator [Spirulina subsalsa FACHB-351]
MEHYLPDILIVDDTPDNLRLLSTMLLESGYKVRKAINGERALQAVTARCPDLILLDIRMPDMTGYEVCQALKDNPATRKIPIIFISALDAPMDKVLAFDVGGVDYISKPFHVAEVLARVESHLKIRLLQQQLEEQNAKLEREVEVRRKTEDALRVYLHAVSHDLRNPVIGTNMVLNRLLESHRDEAQLTVARALVERMATSCDRQLNLINSLLDTREFDIQGITLDCQSLNFYQLTQDFIADWQPILEKNQVTLAYQIPPDLPPVWADANKIWRVLENLTANALKHNPSGSRITLKAELSLSAQCLRCSVIDNGVGIPPEICQGIFELYKRGESLRRTGGLGLGLYLCRQIVESHGGEIGLDSTPGEGSHFWFTLPISNRM